MLPLGILDLEVVSGHDLEIFAATDIVASLQR